MELDARFAGQGARGTAAYGPLAAWGLLAMASLSRTGRPRLPASSREPFHLLLDLACACGFALAIQRLIYAPFWLDETFTAGAASSPSLALMFTRWLGPDVHPPLHYLIEYGLVHLFGQPLWLLRLPSLLAYAATILILRRYGPAIVGEMPARLSSAMIAVLPSVLEHAGEARGYALLMALSTATMVAFLAARKRPSRRATWRFAIFAILLAFTHYFGTLLAGLFFLVLLLRTPASHRRVAVAAAGLFTLVFAPWFIWHGLQLAQLVKGSFWITSIPLAQAAFIAVVSSWGNIPALLLWGAMPLLLCLLRKNLADLQPTAELGIALLLGIVATLVLNQLKPIVVPRYLSAFVPVAMMISAMLLNKAGSIVQKVLSIPLIAFMLVANTAPITTGNVVWREAADRIMAAKVDTVMFIYDGPFIPAFDEDNLAAMGGTFFRSAGYSATVIARRANPNGSLRLRDLPPNAGFALLKIDNRVPGYRWQELMAIAPELTISHRCDPPSANAPQLCLPRADQRRAGVPSQLRSNET